MLRRLRTPALTAALALTALAGWSGDAAAGTKDTGTTESTETGKDTGSDDDSSADGAVLRATDGAEVGQAVTQELEMSMEMSAGGDAIEVELLMTVDVEIVAVDEDGGYRTETVINSIEHLGGDPEGEQIIDTLDPLIGIPMTMQIGADGQQGSVELADDAPPQARVLIEQFGASLSGPPIAFPDEPVAVGDEWSQEVDVSNAGVSLPIEMNFELVGLDDESYTIDIDYVSDIDQMGVTGELTATGTVTGSRTNPLLLDSEMSSDTEISGDGMTLSQRMDVVADAEPAAD